MQWLTTGEPLIEARGQLRERLLAIKSGDVELSTALQWTDDVSEQLQRAHAESVLPDQPDFAAADRLLLRAREAAAVRWIEATDGPWARDMAPLPRETVTDDRYDR